MKKYIASGRAEREDFIVQMSDWIPVEVEYVDESDEDLFPYADKYDDSEDGFYPVTYFEYNGERFALGRFINRWGMMGFDQECKVYPEYIDGYDSENYFTPYYIEISDSGDAVRLYMEDSGSTFN